MNDDDFEYYTKNVVPSHTERIQKKKKYNLMDDLADIPKSSLKKNTGVKTKNGYQQGVEITPMDMATAMEIAKGK